MSYTAIYLHCIFATKNRKRFLQPEHDQELQKYITGIVQSSKCNCKVLAINNIEDHVHILIKIHPSISIAKLMQDIKSNSSKFINEKNRYSYKFAWQNWYACFSYAQSQLKNVINYIQNQKQHHKENDFEKEYIEILDNFQIKYDKNFIFE